MSRLKSSFRREDVDSVGVVMRSQTEPAVVGNRVNGEVRRNVDVVTKKG